MTTPAMIEQVELEPAQLVPHKKNIRADVGDVSALAKSVEAKGVLQPLVVVPNGQPDRYVIIAGHRRHAAAKLAKVATIPCVIRHDLTDEADQIAVMMVENGQRTDLTAMEEAKGVQLLLDLGDNPKAIAGRTGMSLSKVRARAKVAKLPDEIAAKITQHAVTLDDAVFVAEHAADQDALDILEPALGTNNWHIARQRVVDRDAYIKRCADRRKDIAAAGFEIVVDSWEERRAKNSQIADELGVDWTELRRLEVKWPPPAVALDAAAADDARAFVWLVTKAFVGYGSNSRGDGYGEEATLIVYTKRDPADDSDADDCPPDYEDDPTSESETDRDDTDIADADVAEDNGETNFDRRIRERRERDELLSVATTVRHKFISDVIMRGDLDHARLAAQYAAHYLDYQELAWGALLDYLPVEPVDPDTIPDDTVIEDVRAARVRDWMDTQTNPYRLLLAHAWVWLDHADCSLRSTAHLFYDEQAEALDRYAVLLSVCGYTFSDAEQALVDEARERLTPDTEQAEASDGE